MTETSAAPAVKAPPGDGDLSITELVEFEPTRLDGVKSGATGFPFLIMKSAETSAPPAEPEGKPSWHAAAAALARLGAKAPDIDPAELFKAVNAAGEVDEAPDIAAGKQAIALIGKLIEYEAQELQAGCLDEVCDISLLCQAADCLRCWLGMEADADGAMKGCGCCAACTGPGDGCCTSCVDVGKAVAEAEPRLRVPIGFTSGEDFEANFGELGALLVAGEHLTKDSRTFTAAERKQHAKDGNALPDGSYPIPDKDALRRAAILARSGHGDVAAARKLIARRARELGVANPLDEDDDKKAGKSVADVADSATEVQDVHEDDGLSKAVEAAVTKALEGPKAEIATLRAELAKVADLPRPGGPVMALARPTQAASDGIDWLAKAAEAERLASTVTDTADAAAYRQLASQYRRKAAATV